MELVEDRLRVDPAMRESGRLAYLGNVGAAVVGGGADRAWKSARRTAIERSVAYDSEPAHDGTYLRIMPAFVVVLGKAELAIHDGGRGEEVEAVIGGFARLRIDAAGIVLLTLQHRRIGNRDGDLLELIDVAVGLF